MLNRRTRCLVGGNMFDSHVCTTCRPGHRRLSLFIILSFSLNSLNHIACRYFGRRTYIHHTRARYQLLKLVGLSKFVQSVWDIAGEAVITQVSANSLEGLLRGANCSWLRTTIFVCFFFFKANTRVVLEPVKGRVVRSAVFLGT